ncbi:hypothetical protein MHBO_000856 [Bonamia ostreae]|uniref:Uncharacterized protein n=1 Tax=Bonamia ostreae TaxID=126728 RepID=A0ABV2AH97_9EUKA
MSAANLVFVLFANTVLSYAIKNCVLGKKNGHFSARNIVVQQDKFVTTKCFYSNKNITLYCNPSSRPYFSSNETCPVKKCSNDLNYTCAYGACFARQTTNVLVNGKIVSTFEEEFYCHRLRYLLRFRRQNITNRNNKSINIQFKYDQKRPLKNLIQTPFCKHTINSGCEIKAREGMSLFVEPHVLSPLSTVNVEDDKVIEVKQKGLSA